MAHASFSHQVPYAWEVAHVSQGVVATGQVLALGESPFVHIEDLLELVLAALDQAHVPGLAHLGENQQLQHQSVDQLIEVVGFHFQPLIHQGLLLQRPPE